MPEDGAIDGSGTDATASTSETFYLLKAEPETRIEKGKDVKFSVDDFEKVGTSPWEGVRNYEARNIMKEMKVGDQALFYHSNCKNPGIAAFAEVSKLAYPDYTAWDAAHPYYDPKSDSENPKWYMVDLTFKSRAKHFVPLALLKYVASLSLPASSKDDDEVSGLIDELVYLGRAGVATIKGMGLVTRGRLSVQRISQAEWDVINLLAETGGWEDLDVKKLGSSSSSSKAASTSKAKPAAAPKGKTAAAPKRGARSTGKGEKRELEEEDAEEESDEGSSAADAAPSKPPAKAPPAKKSRRGKQSGGNEEAVEDGSSAPVRRSSRRVSSKTHT